MELTPDPAPLAADILSFCNMWNIFPSVPSFGPCNLEHSGVIPILQMSKQPQRGCLTHLSKHNLVNSRARSEIHISQPVGQVPCHETSLPVIYCYCMGLSI